MTPSFWPGKRVFITGDTGFKGSWLSLWLSDLGAHVTGFALEPPTQPSLFDVARIGESIRHVSGDIRDADAVARSIRESSPDFIIHMAAQSFVRLSYQFPVDTFSTNVLGTVNILEAARGAGKKTAVLVVTSDKCYENREREDGYREDDAMGGHDPYSASKGAAEIATSAYRRSFFHPNSKVAVATARSGNVIGGGDWSKDRLVTDIMSALLAGTRPLIRNPDAVRPWQHVLDPLAGYLGLCERLWSDGPDFAEAWNFGPERADMVPVRAVADRLCALWSNNAGWDLDSGAHPHEAGKLYLDCTKARQRLDWSPRWRLDQGLRAVAAWYRNFHKGDDPRTLMRAQIASFMAPGHDEPTEPR